MKISFALSCIFTFSLLLSPFALASDKKKAKKKGRAKIWSELCGHCHNTRNAPEFSDYEWEVASLHMQVHANLTPEESKAVRELMQSSN